ncbi:hypothetical protein F8M41_019405 [Gigaspora margarita]|uniref:Transmembrane protein n=1 Tax=Gigaspora margarita TaxID=4874 RepID=A0A8H4B279_GIGMA|nr:hypothetical protein F8M41_019405 [Gigaspora margarita]
MIPRQSRQISFCEEFDRTLEKVPTPGRLILIINNILVTITLLFFLIDDSSAGSILSSNQNENMTELYGKYGYNHDMASFGFVATGYCIVFCAFIYLSVCGASYKGSCIDNEGRDECEGCNVGCGFALNIPGAILSIPIAYPYLKDQIIGPDYRIIQCDQIDSLGSWQDQWCAHHQRRIILSWLLIFVWFTTFYIYLAITLLIVLVVLCKRAYRISKLWVVYQYQYRKGLFLTWLKEQKDKSRQQQIDPVSAENVKSDLVNKEINIVEVVTIG